MGGMVGGLVGGLLGGSGIGGLANSMMGNIVSDLVEKFGLSDITQAITNLAGDLLQTGLNGIIDSLPIPQFLKDIAKDVVANVIEQHQNLVNPDAQEAVSDSLGGTIQDLVNGILDSINEAMEEESGQAEGGERGSNGNWLVVLAKALGKVAGEHLKRMVEVGNEMASLQDSNKSDEDKAGEMAELQAEFQAEAQMFKMTQESISTMVKSVGEGMSAVARKQ